MSKIPEKVDVLVMGSGVSGLTAALTAAESGAKVAVFEKMRALGGTSRAIKGTFAVESRWQKKRYITYGKDDAFREIMDYGHWRNNPRLVRAIVNESASTIEWLESRGVVITEVTINMINAPQTYHIIRGEGAAVVKALSSVAREMGIEIIPGTPVIQILKDKNGITGAVVKGETGDVRVKTNAVVIGSGGYINNGEWVKKYTGFDLNRNLIPDRNVQKMGDGIRMAWELGAAEEGIGILELFRIGPMKQQSGAGGRISFIVMQPDLWVNQAGERFCDEGITHYDTSEANANARHKEGYTYNIFDDGVKRRVMEEGVDKGVSPDILPGDLLEDFDKDLQGAIENIPAEVFAGDSVEELAEKAGMDPAVLRHTVDEYNSFCAKGHDDLFAKDPKYLRPLVGPRYYAVKAYTVCLGTMGGIRINHKTEVVDGNDNTIPGLYAVGFDAGGMYGNDYCMKVASGLCSAFAFNSGRIAGRNAAAYACK